MMAVQEKTVTIGESDYRIRQLGAREGRKLWLKLLKVMVGPLKVAASAGKLDEMLVVGAAASLIEGFDEETYDEMCETFGKHTSVRVKGEAGEKWPELTGVIFDQHFAANYVAMSQWIGECILFNYGSFLGEASIGNAIDRALKAASKFRSPSSTTGTSSAS